MRKPKTIGVGYASLLERLSQTGSGLLSDCAPCGLLECRAHRLAADQQGHRQSPAPAAHRTVAQIDERVQHKKPREEEVPTPRGSEVLAAWHGRPGRKRALNAFTVQLRYAQDPGRTGPMAKQRWRGTDGLASGSRSPGGEPSLI